MDTNEKSGFSWSDVVFLCGLTMAAVLIPGAVVKLHCFGAGAADRSPLMLGVGIFTSIFAVLLVGFNLYTSFIRPWLFQRSHGTLDDYRYVSGLPALGSILIGIAALFLPSAVWIGVALLLLYFLDPGGILVAAIVLLRDCFSGGTNNA